MNRIPLAGRVLLVGTADVSRTAVTLLDSHGWPYFHAHTPVEAIRHLRSNRLLDLVLLVPGESLDASLELCRSIKFDGRSSMVSVICFLSVAHLGREADVFAAGADDCIRHDASEREIILRLAKACRVKHATDSLEDTSAIITALANAVEGKDHYTCGHVERVGTYSVEIGRRMGIDAEGLATLRMGGVVHDIGKVGVPDQILNKPGKLTDEELAIMRRHPAIGYDILKPLRTFQNVLPIVRWHHEKLNGLGYPDGLKGDEVPLLPRIVAVADVFDALNTDRPYRPAFPLGECHAMLVNSAANGELDPLAVETLIQIAGTSTPMMIPAA